MGIFIFKFNFKYVHVKSQRITPVISLQLFSHFENPYIRIHIRTYILQLWTDRNKEDLKEIRREIEMLQSDIQVGTLRARDLEEEHSRKKEAIRQAKIEKV